MPARPSKTAGIATLVIATVASAVMVYLAYIHMVGFPDGYISPAIRIRTRLAWAFVITGGLAASYYLVWMAGIVRHAKAVMVLHGLSAATLLVLIAFHTHATAHVG